MLAITSEEVRQAMRAAIDAPDGMLAQVRDELRYLRQADAGGRDFTDIATGVIAADGTAIVPLSNGAPIGQIWHLERVTVTVGGVSAAAQVALYLDAPAADVDLLDYANAMLGNSPSRVVFGAPGAPYLIPPGTPVIVAIAAGAVAAPVSVRFQGRAVEVAVNGGRS